MFNAVAVDDRISHNYERLLINYVSKFYSESLKYTWYIDNFSSNFWLCMCVCAQICSRASFTATLFMQSKTYIIDFDFLIFVPKSYLSLKVQNLGYLYRSSPRIWLFLIFVSKT